MTLRLLLARYRPWLSRYLSLGASTPVALRQQGSLASQEQQTQLHHLPNTERDRIPYKPRPGLLDLAVVEPLAFDGLWRLDDALLDHVFESFCGDGNFAHHVSSVICEDLPLVAWESASELLAFLTEIFTAADFLHRLRIYYEKLGPSPFFLQVHPVVASILPTLDWSEYYKRLFAARYGKELEGGRSSIGSGGRCSRQRVSSLRLARGAWPAPQPNPTRWLQIDTVPRQELTTKRCKTPKSPAQVYYHFLANDQPRIVYLYHGTQLGRIDSIFRGDCFNSRECRPGHRTVQNRESPLMALPVPRNPSPPSLLVFELDTAVLHSRIPPTPGTEPFRVDYFADTDAEREKLRQVTDCNMAIEMSQFGSARDGQTGVNCTSAGKDRAGVFVGKELRANAYVHIEVYNPPPRPWAEKQQENISCRRHQRREGRQDKCLALGLRRSSDVLDAHESPAPFTNKCSLV
ncbi:hypothetical protein B0H14DRAFT_3608079 [Mycena olivaceomarginata]|nr:hypothetical protein B0H14DRAFT_3608079 [Mycena olivaceomarginata]